MTRTAKWVTFASVIQTTTGEMDPPTTDQDETPTDSPMITIREETAELKAQETKEESAGLDRIRSVNQRRSRRPMKSSTKCENPAPAEDFLFRDIFCDPSMSTNRSLSESTRNRDRGKVPQWRLARDGPFTNERSQASLRVLGKGCAFRHTAYSVEDHAPPEGGLGVPLSHPHFLEWIGAPESAWLLEMRPGHWCDTLSRDQAMTAAMQLPKSAPSTESQPTRVQSMVDRCPNLSVYTVYSHRS